MTNRKQIQYWVDLYKEDPKPEYRDNVKREIKQAYGWPCQLRLEDGTVVNDSEGIQ